MGTQHYEPMMLSAILGMILDTNWDPCAGVAERPSGEQGPTHSAHAIMILVIGSCNRYSQNMLLFEGHPFRGEGGPKTAKKSPPVPACMPCHLVCFELS